MGSRDQLSSLRQVTLPGSGVWAPGWGRRSRCGGGRSGSPSRWDPLGCAALTGSRSDEPAGQWSGGETQGAGDRRHRYGAGARGTPAHSWRGRCPGAPCLRCAPRTSSRSPCGSGRCAPPGGAEGHEHLQGPREARGAVSCRPGALRKRASSEQVSRKSQSRHKAMVESGAEARLPEGAQKSGLFPQCASLGVDQGRPLWAAYPTPTPWTSQHPLPRVLVPRVLVAINKLGSASSKLCSPGPVTLPL